MDGALISVMQANELHGEIKEHKKVDNSEMLTIAGAQLKEKAPAVKIRKS